MANHSSSSVIRARLLCNCKKKKRRKKQRNLQYRCNSAVRKHLAELRQYHKDRWLYLSPDCLAEIPSPSDLLGEFCHRLLWCLPPFVAGGILSCHCPAANHCLGSQQERRPQKSAAICAWLHVNRHRNPHLNPNPWLGIDPEATWDRPGTYSPLVRQRDNKLQLTKANEMRSMEATYPESLEWDAIPISMRRPIPCHTNRWRAEIQAAAFVIANKSRGDWGMDRGGAGVLGGAGQAISERRMSHAANKNMWERLDLEVEVVYSLATKKIKINYLYIYL